MANGNKISIFIAFLFIGLCSSMDHNQFNPSNQDIIGRMTTTGAKEEVKLLGAKLSPFVIRARLALRLKGVEYEFLEEVFGSKSELLLKSNPVYKKIPVLIHGDKPVCESMIIVEYVDDVWDAMRPSLLPSDPYRRAIARFWAVYIDDKFFPALREILRAKSEEERREAIVQFATPLQLLEEAFEKCSDGKGFFGGDTIGYVDIALGCYLEWIAAAEELTGCTVYDRSKMPNLVGWAERFSNENAVKDIVPEMQEFVAIGRVIQAKSSF